MMKFKHLVLGHLNFDKNINVIKKYNNRIWQTMRDGNKTVVLHNVLMSQTSSFLSVGLCLVPTIFWRLNFCFRAVWTRAVVILGLKRDTKREWDLPCLETMGKEGDLLIPVSVRRRCFEGLASEVSAVVFLVM
jgi:hypothetical protein